MLYQKLRSAIYQGLQKQVPVTGLAVFRIFFGLVIFQEIIFLYYFRSLIFDPTPNVEIASPTIHLFLLFWGIAALFLILGYRTRFAAGVNYFFWVIFTIFTPMWRNFDGGFDQLMISTGFLLLFLPTERGLSLDNLRAKLSFSTPKNHYTPPQTTSVLSYYLPLAISIGLVYLDSDIHKLFAPQWQNGLGVWVPAIMPYYISAINMNWLLNFEGLQKLISHSIVIFEFIFIFICYFRIFRVPILIYGSALHLGIIFTLNIYPFGFAMLAYYCLMVPFAWWRNIKTWLQFGNPKLTVLYDQNCPLCNRTAIMIHHFDGLNGVSFKGLQDHRGLYPQVSKFTEMELLKDLYSMDSHGKVYSGMDTYIQIFKAMKYIAPLGWMMSIPGIYHLGKWVYRKVADNRTRITCDKQCSLSLSTSDKSNGFIDELYARHAGTGQKQATRIAKFLILILLLQLNSSIHYGVFYRLNIKTTEEIGQLVSQISNQILTLSNAFLGITPHAFYLHDHFQGYNHILALTYIDKVGKEHWLPFINQEGRLLAPNWGRVQSMWANVAITPHINAYRFHKFISKVTAFWGPRIGADLQDSIFIIKAKNVEIPLDHWEKDLRNKNIAQPWVDIGKVIWSYQVMEIKLNPEINIESL
ncbi:DCC1-like thiol-disulfide oxidoreductase family protein [Candidatus Nitrosacidococcus tergens]|uniref:Putative thiol-disulfide oxidoreductase DCC n=1 Tax=Candidatus Nitrosacidococcus tergens TaxID=553981 RepID=A0A7G1Q903_9GAMM|nr:DCC1-like thiol-disulfide oxidoreductase family protein [Candidatus Nitrosacidococcus tergens]CAB1275374.1 putative thiol-disulfide oxidoreductase DCC [Candidatus Nitrosacidococcus tergens]